MKKITLALIALVSLLSCDPRKSGNKDILPADENTTAEVVTTEDTTNTQEEEFSYNQDSTTLTWTAYKTPDKMGVNGTFNEIEVSNTKTSPLKEKVLSDADFKINSLSVNTGMADRDEKIQQLFFSNLISPEITGHFGEFKDGIVPVTLKMNDKEVTKNFDYSFTENKLTITGTIDILEDFGAQKSFDILHEACAVLHQDKTWTDVSIEVTTVL